MSINVEKILHARLGRAEAELFLVRQQLAALRKGLFSDPVRLELRLPRREQQLLDILARRERVSGDGLAAALYGNDYEQKGTTLFAHVSKLRAKLRAYGIELYSGRHLGYWIEAEQRALLLGSERLRIIQLRRPDVPAPSVLTLREIEARRANARKNRRLFDFTDLPVLLAEGFTQAEIARLKGCTQMLVSLRVREMRAAATSPEAQHAAA